jgi:sugar phosphate isomerase/epimerase
MMKTHVTRRTFLAGAGCLCGGAAIVSRFGRSVLADEKRALWPVTCRDAVLRVTKQEDCWSALKAINAEGVEIEIVDDLKLPSLFHPTVKYTAATAAGVEQVADDAKAAGQRITGLCMHNQFAQRPKMEIEWCSQVARIAQTWGAPAVRIDVVSGNLTRDEFLKSAVKTLSKVMAATESTGVKFGVENHGNTTNDPTFLRAFFQGVGSERLGLTFDTGNFYWFGHPLSKVYELCEEFAPRVFHTHCKSIRYPAEEREKQRPMGWKYVEYTCPVYRGDLDFARIAAILHKAGYQNDLCIEDESLGKLSGPDATKTLAREVQYLKGVRTAISAQ